MYALKHRQKFASLVTYKYEVNVVSSLEGNVQKPKSVVDDQTSG